MSAIKAVQTRYKGYHFRSRLEARWAVALDAMRIKWEYEPEGFELTSGRYLPDFYLPAIDSGLYVEVKGDPRDWDMCKATEQKLIELSAMTGKPCLFVFAPEVASIEITADSAAPAGYWMGSRSLLSSDAIAAARSARFEFGQSGATA